MATRRTSWSAPITGEPNRIAPAQDGPAEAGPFFFCAVRSRKPEDPRRQKQHLTEDQVGQMQYLSFDHTFVTSSFLGADARYPRLLRGCGNGKLTPDRFRAATANQNTLFQPDSFDVGWAGSLSGSCLVPSGNGSGVIRCPQPCRGACRETIAAHRRSARSRTCRGRLGSSICDRRKTIVLSAKRRFVGALTGKGLGGSKSTISTKWLKPDASWLVLLRARHASAHSNQWRLTGADVGVE